jgi:hypothetical protein
MTDNVQKVNNCINIPPSQILRSYLNHLMQLFNSTPIDENKHGPVGLFSTVTALLQRAGIAQSV